ncbi:MAG: MFS transporter [Candidatus Latescibacteria bacterium]|nr:MFS transporter [Candidatus Latescibacterota bacterium]
MDRCKGTPYQALFGATLGFFIGFAAVALFGPAASRFQEVMGLSPIQVGFLVAMPSLSGSLLRIPFSAWVDTTGGRKPFLVLLSLSIAGMGGLALVVNLFYPDRLHSGLYPLLLLLGVLCGCGIAIFSVGITQVSYWFPRARQGRALALYAGIGNLAPGIFSFLLPIALVTWGLLGAYSAWLTLLVIGAVAYGFTGCNAWYFQLRHQGLPPEEARRLAQAHGEEFFPSEGIRESLAISARNWKTWALLSVYFSTFGGFVALTAWLPIYWTSYFAVSAVAAGALTGGYSILTSGIRLLGGVLSDELREGGENTAILGLFIMLFGAVLMTTTEHFQVAVPGVLLMAVGMGICNAAVFKIVPQEVPDAVGGAAGWIGGLGAFGGFVIPPIMGAAVRQHGEMGYPLGFITFVVLALLSLSLMWVLKYSRPLSAAETGRVAPAGIDADEQMSATGDRVPAYRVIIDTSRCWEHATSDGNLPCDVCARACQEVFEKPLPNAPARVRRGAEVGCHLPGVREAIRRCPANSILLVELVDTES